MKTGQFSLKLNNYTSIVKLTEKGSLEENESKNNTISRLIDEMQKMKENNVLENAIKDYEEIELEYYVYAREYSKNKKEYVVNRIILTTDGKEKVDIQLEEKTGKALYYISNHKYNIKQDISEEEILINYIKYLDLYIIDDWKFERNMLISEKAKLVVVLRRYERENVISIHSTNNQYIRETYNLIN